MIYNRNESEVAVLGEVQKHKVGIDEKNINHIVTILSSNLYSHPMASFLRETVSNAVDSHIEAKVDEPIIIHKTATDLSIRDYGTGISPERFQEIFLNIGSSTKRESNEYIGHFGLGRFSCLSVSNLANITSFYNGKAYYYVMNKDIDQLHIDLLYEKDTNEPNGVEVKIPTEKFSTNNFKCIAFIDNLYVISDIPVHQNEVDNFNIRKIGNYKYFKTLSSGQYKSINTREVLLGNIPYTVDWWEVWGDNDTEHFPWIDTFKDVYPKIEIGSVDITPNREDLLYSERTKEVLRKAYDNCIAELTELWNAQCDKEYEDFGDYILELTMNRHHQLLNLDADDIVVPNSLPYNISYKEFPEWKNIDPKQRKSIACSLIGREIDVLCRIQGETLSKGRRTTFYYTINKLIQEIKRDKDITFLALPSAAGFSSQYFKEYLNEKYTTHEKLILRQPRQLTIRYVKENLISIFDINTLNDPVSRRFIFQLCKKLLQYLGIYVEVTSIIGSDEYNAYKKAHMTPKTRTSTYTENILFTLNSPSWREPLKTTCKINELIPIIKNRYSKMRLVYSYLDSPFLNAFMHMGYPNLITISAAKGKMPHLIEGLPEWVRPIEELYSPDNRVLQKYATISYIMNQPRLDYSYRLRGFFPKHIVELVEELSHLKNKYSATDSIYEEKKIISIVPPEKYDRYILALFNLTKKYLTLSYRIKNNEIFDSSYEQVYLLMKAKKFRVDYTYYRYMKTKINNLLNRI